MLKQIGQALAMISIVLGCCATAALIIYVFLKALGMENLLGVVK